MSRSVSACIALVLAAGTASGAGSIISSFPSPCSAPVGMCYQGGYLYHMNTPDGAIYQTTTKGSIVRSIYGPPSSMGVHFTGTYFWVCTYATSLIVRLSSNGSFLESFNGPAQGYGIATNGTYFWYSSARSGNMVWQLTMTGSIIGSFSGPASLNGGLDWDARGYLWLADWDRPGNGGVFRITTVGSVVESYRPVPNGGRSSGCAWDGRYLWYCDLNPPRYVYQIDTAIAPVVPSSLGKVKALFR